MKHITIANPYTDCPQGKPTKHKLVAIKRTIIQSGVYMVTYRCSLCGGSYRSKSEYTVLAGM